MQTNSRENTFHVPKAKFVAKSCISLFTSDPLISVEVFGRVESSDNHESSGETAVCSVTNLAGEANIRFHDDRTSTHLNETLYKNQPNLKRGEYHQGMLITHTSYRRPGFLTCHVADRFGTYSKTIEIPRTGKYHAIVDLVTVV